MTQCGRAAKVWNVRQRNVGLTSKRSNICDIMHYEGIRLMRSFIMPQAGARHALILLLSTLLIKRHPASFESAAATE